ncbi:sel1 repeat family protein [Lysobacter solisilvae (ex Woo and Kim 2020)]|uniref:Sel1 repeat family protein n=1 Tax=Agrilutibacter terrestris TaxID=2865112 RepID=A0A7H0FTV4_9GAMM|nr:sel1 repeat family protein [Lysobacter terrestris]QNP39470.1 sel1 repeat family protein [Lysobacter terrestris]
MSKLHALQPSALALLLAIAPATALAEQKSPPPDPLDNPLLITAGFLSHHQDIQYRLLGMDAYKEKRFEDAMRYFRRAGYFADKPSQGMVGEMYWNGEGVEADRALAYAWMDLAAERGYTGFLGLREKYWQAMNEGERARAIEQGQALYARFGDAAAKPRYEAELRRGKNSIVGSRTGFNRGVKIEVPGPAGSQMIDGSKFYDERYWNAKKYWAWQDGIWAKPRVGKVSVGEAEAVHKNAPGSRIPETEPEIDAPAPEVPEPTPSP